MNKSRLKELSTWSKPMFAIALPVMLQSSLEYVFVFTDMAFVGSYDQAGLSAINTAMAPVFLIISFFIALSQGLTIIISQNIGASRFIKARRTAESSIGFLTLMSWMITLFWLALAPFIMKIMGLSGHQFDLAVTYVSILSLQGLTLGLGLCASSIFQAQGKTLPIMLSSIAKALLNIFLNWLLIFGNWGFWSLGIAGSALGTVISSCLLDIWLFVLVIKMGKKRNFRLRISMMLRPRWRLAKGMFKIGLPVGLEYILWSLGQAVIIAMVNPLSQHASGYFGVFNTIIVLSCQIYNGFGVATLVLVGQATGAKRVRDIGTIASWGLLSSIIACVLTSIVFLIGAKFLLGLFITDTVELEALVPVMVWAVLIVFPKAVNILAGNAIRGTGNTMWMLKTQIAGSIGIVVVAAIGVYGFNITLVALLLAVCLDEFGRGLVNLIKFYREQKKRVQELT